MALQRLTVARQKVPLPGPGEVHVWCVGISEDPECLSLAYATLCFEERRRVEGLRNTSARTLFVVSRGILRSLLGNLCDVAPARVSLGYGTNGKPFLLGEDRIFHFNLSHSANFAIFALCLDADVGVDVEFQRPIPEMMSIARSFSPSEYDTLQQLPQNMQLNAFFDCWVRKEAYVKGVGAGLSIPLDSFWVSFAPGEPTALLGVRNNMAECREWTLHSLPMSKGYSGAVAVRRSACCLCMHDNQSAIELLSAHRPF